MAKIMLYEDYWNDIADRYDGITKIHDVFVFHDGAAGSREDNKYELERLREWGFNPDNIRWKSEGCDWFSNPPEALVYFVDGLQGRCFDILPKLPRDRAFLNSTHPDIKREAKEQGYNVIDPRETNLEKLIHRVLHGIR